MEHIKISMTPKASLSICHVTQNDNGREVSIDFEDYTLTGAEDVSLIIRKPDGTRVEAALENTASNFVIWSSDPSECDVVGLANCEIKAEDDGVVLYSASFNMNIEADPYGSDVTTLTATGNPCTFDTDLADALVSLTANINASGGNGTPDNPIPIVGHSELNLTRCGVNLARSNYSGGASATQSGVTFTNNNGVVNVSATLSTGEVYYNFYANSDGQRLQIKAGTYTVSCAETTASCTIPFRVVGVDAYLLNNNTHSVTFTATEDTEMFAYIRVLSGTSNINLDLHFQIELGSSSTDFEPYNGQTFTVAFGQTVYGGVYDKSGRLTITHAYETINSFSGLVEGNGFRTNTYLSQPVKEAYGALTCNMFTRATNYSQAVGSLQNSIGYNAAGQILLNVYENGAYITDINDINALIPAEGVQIAYELSTPIVIDVQAISPSAEIGTNNVVSDGGGDVSVTYIKKV